MMTAEEASNAMCGGVFCCAGNCCWWYWADKTNTSGVLLPETEWTGCCTNPDWEM